MKKITKLLVVINAEETSNTDAYPIELEKSLRLASDQSSVELHLFCVAYQKYLHHDFLSIDFNQLQRRQEYCDQLVENLNSIAKKLRSDGYKVVTDVAWGYPNYEKVIEKAGNISADLIVQHCRAYGKLDFRHLSNDSWQLVRHCPTPLLLSKNRSWAETPIVLAAVDPMHSHDKPLALDTKIMTAAQTLCEETSAQLHVVHAYAESARPFAVAGVIEAEHSKALHDFLAPYSVPADHLHFVDETPVMALQHQTLALNSDIVAMGALSRSRLSEMLIGSTAEQVLDYVDTDILILK